MKKTEQDKQNKTSDQLQQVQPEDFFKILFVEASDFVCIVYHKNEFFCFIFDFILFTRRQHIFDHNNWQTKESAKKVKCVHTDAKKYIVKNACELQ
jgi:hypothetical protein